MCVHLVFILNAFMPISTVFPLQLTIDIYQLKNLYPFDLSTNKERNDLAPDEVANSYVFRGNEDADISIVLGPPIRGQCHLVLARFHKPKTFPMNQELMDKLFVDLMARVTNLSCSSLPRPGTSLDPPGT